MLADNRSLVATLGFVTATACAVADTAYRDDGQTFANAAVHAIAGTWNADALIKRADPQFLQALPEAKAREMIAGLSSQLGPLKRATPKVAQVGYNLGGWIGKGAQYLIQIECQRGTATLAILVRKVRDTWRILGFHVNIETAK